MYIYVQCKIFFFPRRNHYAFNIPHFISLSRQKSMSNHASQNCLVRKNPTTQKGQEWDPMKCTYLLWAQGSLVKDFRWVLRMDSVQKLVKESVTATCKLVRVKLLVYNCTHKREFVLGKGGQLTCNELRNKTPAIPSSINIKLYRSEW